MNTAQTLPIANRLAWNLGDRLRKALSVANLSVQDMADELELNRNTVSNYLGGRSTPTAATLKVWALRCGVPLEWLRDGVINLTDGGDDPSATPSEQAGSHSGWNGDGAAVLNFPTLTPIRSAGQHAA